MRASPADQQLLLDLAAQDAVLARCAGRRRTLPALAALAAAEARAAELAGSAASLQTELGDRSREQQRLENDVDQVRGRAARDRQRLDAGAVGNARELESLQSEIASLARRQAALEDDVLVVMEAREVLDSELARVQATLAEVTAQIAAAQSERDTGLADIAAEERRAQEARSDIAGRIPADLAALYERLRAGRDGVGAAALLRRRCQGCHLELSGAELAAARGAEPDEVLRCEECGRILVRTAESGL